MWRLGLAAVLLHNADILWDLEARHLREAEFLFAAREHHLDAPDYTLADLYETWDKRMVRHVHALVVGGPIVARELLCARIEDEFEARETVTVAVLALLHESGIELCERVLVGLDRSEEADHRDGIGRALQLSARAGLDAWLSQSLPHSSGLGLAVRLRALARRHVVPGPWIAERLADESRAVVTAAVELARGYPPERSLPGLLPLAQSDDPELRRVTLETALVRGIPGAWESALYWAFGPRDTSYRRDALTWVGLLGDAQAHTRLLSSLDDPARRADALWAASFSGRVESVDRCLELLGDEEHGRRAAEVVTAIGGLPTDDRQFWLPEPELDEDEEARQAFPAFAEEDLDEDLTPAHDARLPRPNPDAIARWWQTQRARLDPGLRYIAGRELDATLLLAALADGPGRRRHARAFELEVRSRGAARVSTRALVETQARQLEGLAGLDTLDCQSGQG